MRNLIRHGAGERPAAFYGDTGHGEFYVPRDGITYSDPGIASYFEALGRNLGCHADEPWLVCETERLLNTTREHPLVMVEGDLGAGKSTALYGLRSRLREEGRSYTLINGHFLDRAKNIVTAIHRATRLEQIVIFDSFDYLYMRNSKRQEAKHARQPVTEAMARHLAEGGKAVTTAHTWPWFNRFSNPELYTQFTEFARAAGAVTFRVYGLLQNPSDLHSVCEKISGPAYANAYVPLATISPEPTAMTYRVAKLIGRVIDPMELPDLPSAEFDTHVRQIDKATRTRMGADPAYSLLTVV